MVLVAGCDDEKRVDGVRPAPREVGVGFTDVGAERPTDATQTFDGGPGQSDATSGGVDAGPRCEESPVVDAPPPVGRCPAVVPAFAEVPCDTTLTLPGLTAPGEIVFTEQGVPHIYARTVADAARLQGYIVARDRFFELELTRRNTLGELSGWFSALTLATDIENRTYGQAQAARRILNQGSSPEMRAYFAAYADGINLWRTRLLAGLEVRPPEFLVVGDVVTLQDDATIVPEWTAQDVAAGAAAITYALAFDGEDLGRSEALGRAAEFGAGLPAEALRRDAALGDIIGALAPLTETTQTGAEVPKRARRAARRAHARWPRRPGAATPGPWTRPTVRTGSRGWPAIPTWSWARPPSSTRSIWTRPSSPRTPLRPNACGPPASPSPALRSW
jgi:hypothetical protein